MAQDNNTIYDFLKKNNLTTKSPEDFYNQYADTAEATKLFDFFKSNNLTTKDFNSFYDEYLKKKAGGEDSWTGFGEDLSPWNNPEVAEQGKPTPSATSEDPKQQPETPSGEEQKPVEDTTIVSQNVQVPEDNFFKPTEDELVRQKQQLEEVTQEYEAKRYEITSNPNIPAETKADMMGRYESRISELQGMTTARSEVGQQINQKLIELIEDGMYDYYTTPSLQKEAKKTLLEAFGPQNERAIDNVLRHFDELNRRDAIVEKAVERYENERDHALATRVAPQGPSPLLPVHESIDKTIGVNFEKMVHDAILTEDQNKVAKLYDQLRAEYQKETVDTKKVKAIEDELTGLGYDPKKGWIDPKTGYRYGAEQDASYTHSVNGYVDQYKTTPFEQLTKIAKDNYLIYEQLLNEEANTRKQYRRAWDVATRAGDKEKAMGNSVGGYGVPTYPDMTDVSQEELATTPQRLEYNREKLDYLNGSQQYRSQIQQAKAALEGSIRALKLNMTPEQIGDSGIFQKLFVGGKAFVEQLVGQQVANSMGTDMVEIKQGLQNALATGDMEVKPEELEMLNVSTGEEVMQQLGSTLGFVTELALLEGAGNVAGLSKMVTTLSKGNVFQRMAGHLVQNLWEGSKFAIAGDGSKDAFVEGMLFHNVMKGLNKIPLFKHVKTPKDWYVQMAKQMPKASLSMTTASQMTQGMRVMYDNAIHDKDLNYEVEKRFGSDLPSWAKHTIIELGINSLFGINTTFKARNKERQYHLYNLRRLKKMMDGFGAKEESDWLGRILEKESENLIFKKIKLQDLKDIEALADPVEKINRLTVLGMQADIPLNYDNLNALKTEFLANKEYTARNNPDFIAKANEAIKEAEHDIQAWWDTHKYGARKRTPSENKDDNHQTKHLTVKGSEGELPEIPKPKELKTDPAPKQEPRPKPKPIEGFELIHTFNTKFSVVKTKNDNGAPVIHVVDNENVPVDPKVASRAITHMRKNFDFDYGETSYDAVERLGVDIHEGDDVNKVILEHSSNPAEVLNHMSTLERYIPEEHLDYKDRMIAENLGKVKASSFARFGDKNKVTMSIAKSYFKKDGEGIDQIVTRVNWEKDLITEEDVVNFMMAFPNGSHTFFQQPNPDYVDMGNKFFNMTGISPTSSLIERYAHIPVGKNEVMIAPDEDYWQGLFDEKAINDEDYHEFINTFANEITESKTNESGKSTTQPDGRHGKHSVDQGGNDGHGTRGSNEEVSQDGTPLRGADGRVQEGTIGPERKQESPAELTPYQKEVARQFDQKIAAANEVLKKAISEKQNKEAELQNRNGLFGDTAEKNPEEQLFKTDFDPTAENIRTAIKPLQQKIDSAQRMVDELIRHQQQAIRQAGEQYDMSDEIISEVLAETDPTGRIFAEESGKKNEKKSKSQAIQLQLNWEDQDVPAIRNHIESVDASPLDLQWQAVPLHPFSDNVITHVEILLTSLGQVNFIGDPLTGPAIIQSPDDVAFLFKNLEQSAVEHGFAVHIMEDGSYKVQYISTGGIAGTVMDPKLIVGAAGEFASKSVCFVHNHPSGSLTPSPNDVELTRKMKGALESIGVSMFDPVIIDTDSGFYTIFNDAGSHFEQAMRRANPSDAVVEVFQFNQQKLYTPSQEKTRIASSEDVATYLSKMKRGTTNKLHVIILARDNKVNRYFLMDETTTAEEFVSTIIKSATKSGSAVILASNAPLPDASLRMLANACRFTDISLLDTLIIHQEEDILRNYTSMADEGKLPSEPEVPYEAVKPNDKVKNTDMTDDPHGSVPVFYAMELPEMVDLVKRILGKYPRIRNLTPGQGGYFHAVEGRPEFSNIVLNRALFRLVELEKQGKLEQSEDIEAIRKTLAHEFGHLLDYMTDDQVKTTKRGNILGHIAGERKYLKSLLGESFKNPKVLTKNDRARLRRQAEKELRDAQFNGPREIIETIIEEIPIFSETGVTPEEILSIWTDVNARQNIPDLYDLIAKLSSLEKKMIMKQAMKGVVDEYLAGKLAKRQVGVKKVERTVKRTVEPEQVSKEAIKKRYRELLEQEIIKMHLFKKEQITKELRAVTQKLRPYNEAASSAYTTYRNKPAELYADAVSMLFTDPDGLKEMAPNFYRAFFNWFDARKGAKAVIEEVQEFVGSGKEPVIEKRESDIKAGFKEGKIKRAAAAVKKKVEELGIKDALSQAFISRGIPVINKIPRYEEGEHGMTQRENLKDKSERVMFVNEEVGLLVNRINNIFAKTEKLGVSIDDLGLIASMIRNTADRYGFANPLGMQAEYSLEQLDAALDRYSLKQRTAINDALQQFHDLFHSIATQAYEAGIFSRATWETKIEPNKDTYVAYGVLIYIDKTSVTPLSKPMKGTLEGIENPIYTTAAKAAALIMLTRKQELWNELKASYDEFQSGVIIPAQRKWRSQPRVTKEGYKLHKVLVDGRVTAYQVPDYMKTLLERPELTKGLMLGAKPFLWFNKMFKPLVTTLNAGFMYYSNPMRDIQRSLNNMAAILHGKGIQTKYGLSVTYSMELFNAIAESSKYVYLNKVSEDLAKMLENGVLFTGWFSRGDTETYDLLEPIMKQHGLVPKEPGMVDKMNNVEGLRQLIWLLSKIEGGGQVIELSSKVAGYKVLQQHLDPNAAAYFARNYVGTPNYRDGSTLSPFLSAIMPFYTVIIQSLRSGAELATNKKTRGRYWYLKALIAGLPAMATALFGSLIAISKLFDKEDYSTMAVAARKYASLHDKISEYDKMNYLCFILGEAENGDPVYIRLQLDEESRLAYATTYWAARSLIEGNTKGSRQLLSLGTGLTPSMSPLLAIGTQWKNYMMNTMPMDEFYGSPVMSQDELDAGVKHSFGPMVKWTLNKSGFRPFTKVLWRDNLQPFTMNDIPYNRFIKIGGQGERERYDYVTKAATREQAQERIWLKENIREKVQQAVQQNNLSSPTPMSAILTDVQAKIIAMQVWKEYADKFGVKAILKEKSISTLSKMLMEVGTDNKYSNIVMNLTYYSNEERVKMLNYLSESMTEQEYADLTSYLVAKGFIKKNLLLNMALEEKGGEKGLK